MQFFEGIISRWKQQEKTKVEQKYYPPTPEGHLEKFKDRVAQDPKIDCHIVDFSNVPTRNEKFPPHGDILRSHEYRTIAENMYQEITERGGIIPFGKTIMFYTGGGGYTEYKAQCSNGKMRDFLDDESLDYFEGVLNTSQTDLTLLNDGYVCSAKDRSAITVQPQTTDRAIAQISARDQQEKPQVMKAISSALDSISDENGFFHIRHYFTSETSNGRSGENLPVHITYMVPSDLGQELEQIFSQDPWCMEALSLYVMEQMEKSTNNDTGDFQFLSHYRNYEIRTFQGSSTQEIAGLFSYYDKPKK